MTFDQTGRGKFALPTDTLLPQNSVGARQKNVKFLVTQFLLIQ